MLAPSMRAYAPNSRASATIVRSGQISATRPKRIAITPRTANQVDSLGAIPDVVAIVVLRFTVRLVRFAFAVNGRAREVSRAHPGKVIRPVCTAGPRATIRTG